MDIGSLFTLKQCEKHFYRNQYDMEEADTKSLLIYQDTESNKQSALIQLARLNFDKEVAGFDFLDARHLSLLDEIIPEAKDAKIAEVFCSENYKFTQKMMDNGKIIFNGSVKFKDIIAFIHVLLPLKDGSGDYQLIYLSNAFYPNEQELELASLMLFIAKNADKRIKSGCYATRNASFRCSKEHNYSKFFDLIPLEAATEAKFNEMKELVKKANEIKALEVEPKIKAGKHCFSTKPCPYIQDCISG